MTTSNDPDAIRFLLHVMKQEEAPHLMERARRELEAVTEQKLGDLPGTPRARASVLVRSSRSGRDTRPVVTYRSPRTRAHPPRRRGRTSHRVRPSGPAQGAGTTHDAPRPPRTARTELRSAHARRVTSWRQSSRAHASAAAWTTHLPPSPDPAAGSMT